MFFHGGGWVIGDLDTHEVVCRKLANEGDGRRLGRLPPRARTPIPRRVPTTATRPTTWVAANAKKLGTDAAHGWSAATAPAATSPPWWRLWRATGGGPSPAASSSSIPRPILRERPSTASPRRLLLTHSDVKWFGDHYLNATADIDHWKASAARAATHAGLPPSYVLTADSDPLCDGGAGYAAR